MIFREVTCFKLVFLITVYAFEELIAFNLLSKTVRIFKEQLCTISIFRFDKVVVKVVHQRFADIEDAHSATDRFIECQLRSLHVDFNEILIEYGQLLEVWFSCKFLCFLAVFYFSHIHVIPDVSIVFPKKELLISLKKSFRSHSFYSQPRVDIDMAF